MSKRIVFKNMTVSQPMKDHANEQLEKIEKFLSNETTPIFIDLFLEPSHVNAHHDIDLRIKTPHFEKNISFEGPDFYKVLDKVIDTMYIELREEKKRREENLKMVGRHDEFKKQR